MLSDIIFPKGDSGFERNPVLRYRSAVDWISAALLLFSVCTLLALSAAGAVSSDAASHWLLALLALYFAGELLIKVDALLKPVFQVVILIVLLASSLVSVGASPLSAALAAAFAHSLLWAVPLFLAMWFFQTQSGTWTHTVFSAALGVATGLMWIAILVYRGQWAVIDPGNQYASIAIVVMGWSSLFVPGIFKDAFLRFGFPICTVVYLSMKDAGNDFPRLVQLLFLTGSTLIAFAAMVAALIFAVGYMAAGKKPW